MEKRVLKRIIYLSVVSVVLLSGATIPLRETFVNYG